MTKGTQKEKLAAHDLDRCILLCEELAEWLGAK